jgi:hypothetical protein
MLLDCVEIFLSRVRQRAQQSYEFAPGEALGSDGDNLTDRFAASFDDESLVAIAHAVNDF